ncbi:hypothetical protein GWI33_005795 [Rhynchophorus ferrugineus]|uniref:Uncharacterized protein n=1 Tax=Rhynchophorus ferrugineus TaxID=354439 RepID=A0A834IUL7_RHYFE|nr:hypothetical protein GWI33_005795 [Rhynchophorus ferrugineus]
MLPGGSSDVVSTSHMQILIYGEDLPFSRMLTCPRDRKPNNPKNKNDDQHVEVDGSFHRSQRPLAINAVPCADVDSLVQCRSGELMDVIHWSAVDTGPALTRRMAFKLLPRRIDA